MVRFRLIGCLLVFGLGLFGVASCSSPDLELDGLACSSAGECAEGFVCRPSTQTCVPEGSDIGDGGDGEPCTTDVDEDGLCAEDDCDDSDATCDAAGCVDADSDGTPACQDPCDDPDDECQTCEDSDNDGVCVDDDCDDTVPSCTNDCTTDRDSDSQRDCDDTCVDVDGDGLGRGNLDNAGCGEGLMMTDSDDDVATECADSDEDGCDDCSVNSQFTPLDDGADGDSDGLCDVGDTCNDKDGDGLGDGTNDNSGCGAGMTMTDVDDTGGDSGSETRCADTDSDGCDDCSVTSQFNPGDDGIDLDGDGICTAGDCNDTASNGGLCGLGSCQDCPPETFELTSPATGPVCPDSVEFELDAGGVQFAEDAISCVGDRGTVSLTDFDDGTLGVWRTPIAPMFSAENGIWPDDFDGATCGMEGQFARFPAEGNTRSITYDGIDASGLVDLRLEFIAASRGGTSILTARACCNDNGACDRSDTVVLLSEVEISSSQCDVEGAGLPDQFDGCGSLRISIEKQVSETAILAIDDLTILGSPEVSDLSEVGGGNYSFDIQACFPGEYSVTCTYNDNGVPDPELTSSSSVTLEGGG
ncbi:MAG: hypothetical protein AAFZ38_01465 [Myxococcota bacterium]